MLYSGKPRGRIIQLEKISAGCPILIARRGEQLGWDSTNPPFPMLLLVRPIPLHQLIAMLAVVNKRIERRADQWIVFL
jgi:hypothetical protein